MPKIVHLRENCIGCNSCVEYAPGYWQISLEDGKSNLVGSTFKKGVYILEITPSELFENELASRNCPVKIIKIFK